MQNLIGHNMAINDITGDKLVTKTTNDDYRSGWDRIFGNKNKKTEDTQPEQVTTEESKSSEASEDEQ